MRQYLQLHGEQIIDELDGSAKRAGVFRPRKDAEEPVLLRSFDVLRSEAARLFPAEPAQGKAKLFTTS